ncbi:HNH endonuclease [Chitinophaga sp. S165]|uniref:HNH endonuclease n=1 Tax=Chitinophaga sp. S165 TaxID=2135462 RepID=UPI000D70E4CB|nr:HNH endonuclease [Chitinophaga sp. S165]
MMTPNNAPYKYLLFKGDRSYRRYVQKDVLAKFRPAKTKDHASLNVNHHGSYGALLFHPNWKAKRKEILIRDMYRCVHCRSDKDLQVHHRQYHFVVSEQKFRFPWEYPNHLLITLCESCHNKGHNRYKVPTITI